MQSMSRAQRITIMYVLWRLQRLQKLHEQQLIINKRFARQFMGAGGISEAMAITAVEGADPLNLAGDVTLAVAKTLKWLGSGNGQIIVNDGHLILEFTNERFPEIKPWIDNKVRLGSVTNRFFNIFTRQLTVTDAIATDWHPYAGDTYDLGTFTLNRNWRNAVISDVYMDGLHEFNTGWGVYSHDDFWIANGKKLILGDLGDTNLYRSAANILKTDDLLDAVLGFQVNGVAGVDGNFTTVDGKTVTVTKGIITSIV